MLEHLSLGRRQRPPCYGPKPEAWWQILGWFAEIIIRRERIELYERRIDAALRPLAVGSVAVSAHPSPRD
jgi:hypothetical protein